MVGTVILENGQNVQQTVEREHKPEQELVPTPPRLTVVQIVLEKLPKQDLVKNENAQVISESLSILGQLKSHFEDDKSLFEMVKTGMVEAFTGVDLGCLSWNVRWISCRQEKL